MSGRCWFTSGPAGAASAASLRRTSPICRRRAATLTVALRSGDDTQVKHWLARKRLALPVVNDPAGTLSAQWQIGVTPTFVVVSQGKVVQSTTGWTQLLGMKLRLWWAAV